MGPGAGNRQDNRQRGNAAQLLEKYKTMARDAQMQGDRVQTEYFLQFADHYYRILNENRARFEEQRRQRGDSYEGYEDEDQDELEASGDTRERSSGGDEPEAREAEGGRDEPRRQGNGEFRGRGRNRSRYRDEGEAYAERVDEGRDIERSDERIAADILPPSIGAVSGGEADEEAAPAPRRRGRRPRGDAEEVAPAA
jgi:hypothetical protein